MRLWREACALRMLEAEKRTKRTEAICAARIVFTRYEARQNGRLSRQSAAGNLTGNTDARLSNLPNSLRKLVEFESSHGHQ
jgi:hypothetical protein